MNRATSGIAIAFCNATQDEAMEFTRALERAGLKIKLSPVEGGQIAARGLPPLPAPGVGRSRCERCGVQWGGPFALRHGRKLCPACAVLKMVAADMAETAVLR